MKNYFNVFFCLVIFSVWFASCKKENINHDSIVGNWWIASYSVTESGVVASNFSYEKDNTYRYQFNKNNNYILLYRDSLYKSGTYSADSSGLSFYTPIGTEIETVGPISYGIVHDSLTISSSSADS